MIPGDKVGIMPGSAPMHFKLVFEVPTGGSWVLRPSEEEMWTNGGCDCSHGFYEWHYPGFKESGAVLFTSIWHSQRCGKSGGSGGLKYSVRTFPPGSGYTGKKPCGGTGVHCGCTGKRRV